MNLSVDTEQDQHEPLPFQVDNFLRYFKILQRLTQDDPERIPDLHGGCKILRELCIRLEHLDRNLSAFEPPSTKAFTPHGASDYAKARAEYKQRWRPWVARRHERIFEKILKDNGLDDSNETITPFDKKMSKWQAEGERHRAQILRMREVIQSLIDNGSRPGEWEADLLKNGLNTLKFLDDMGFDIADHIWRHRVIGYVRIPDHVASQYDDEGANLYRMLNNAVTAICGGAPLAAIAILRPVMKDVAQKHWDSTDDKKYIDELPLPEERKAALKRRLDQSNHVLHERAHEISRETEYEEALGYLADVRFLIEQTPKA